MTEVNKIKKHNLVLKKALLQVDIYFFRNSSNNLYSRNHTNSIQEQERTKSLELTLREKDDKIRASIEEIDNLSFNNTRLTKRIQAMQNELEEVLVTH